MRSGVALFLIAVCSIAACAIQEAPPGGPVDNKPPRVVGTVPIADSSGVAPDSDIRIAFDESMTKTRFERFVDSYPRILVGKTGWSKNAFVLQPQGDLHPDTTYVIVLRPGFSDSHGVRSDEHFTFGFATSTAIDSGAIGGRVIFRRQPSKAAVVRVFVLPKDTAFAPEATIADREVGVNDEGEFTISYLPTDNRRFVVWAYEDIDNNGAFVAEQDAAVDEPDTVLLTGTAPSNRSLEYFITDPREPATVSGTVVDSTGLDTLVITLAMHAVSDTTPPTYVTRANSDGEFKFVKVLQGRYTLWAFADFAPDSLCGSYPCPDDTTRQCAEPCAQYPDTLVIEPGEEVALERFVLEPSGKE